LLTYGAIFQTSAPGARSERHERLRSVRRRCARPEAAHARGARESAHPEVPPLREGLRDGEDVEDPPEEGARGEARHLRNLLIPGKLAHALPVIPDLGNFAVLGPSSYS